MCVARARLRMPVVRCGLSLAVKRGDLRQARNDKDVEYSNRKQIIKSDRMSQRPIPFKLRPSGKDYLWGGTRLRDVFHKPIALTPLAETWECSTHSDGLSYVDGGAFDGWSLKEVLAAHPEYAGTPEVVAGELPILIKFIDAEHDLSVQVHPNDAYAREHEAEGLRGKNEMWYVVDASPEAELVYGLSQSADAEELRRSIAEGRLEHYLRRIPIRKGDVFYIPAGTIHAIGKGALIVEVQQSSNLTYRLYDYNRRDKTGRLRPLHIDKALAVAELHGLQEPCQPRRVLRRECGMTCEQLCSCPYFRVERLVVQTADTCPDGVKLRVDERSFAVLLCLEGDGILTDGSEVRIAFSKGECLFVPAYCPELKVVGSAELLCVRC